MLADQSRSPSHPRDDYDDDERWWFRCSPCSSEKATRSLPILYVGRGAKSLPEERERSSERKSELKRGVERRRDGQWWAMDAGEWRGTWVFGGHTHTHGLLLSLTPMYISIIWSSTCAITSSILARSSNRSVVLGGEHAERTWCTWTSRVLKANRSISVPWERRRERNRVAVLWL